MQAARRALVILSFSASLSALACGLCLAQSAQPPLVGGNSLVVSRASVPAPTAPTMPSLATALADSWRWNLVALASARGWAWSFAPALAASYSRPVAVRRRAI